MSLKVNIKEPQADKPVSFIKPFLLLFEPWEEGKPAVLHQTIQGADFDLTIAPGTKPAKENNDFTCVHVRLHMPPQGVHPATVLDEVGEVLGAKLQMNYYCYLELDEEFEKIETKYGVKIL